MKFKITTPSPAPSPMSALPLEILEYICECAAEPVAAPGYGEQGACSAGQLGSRDAHYSALIGLSGASQKFREISAPYLFRRLKVRTVEQAAQIVASPLLGYARYVAIQHIDRVGSNIRHFHFQTHTSSRNRRPNLSVPSSSIRPTTRVPSAILTNLRGRSIVFLQCSCPSF